jgi:ferredoxin--NADP+ reductase
MVSIAIVGAGPSGCFTAQALAKALPEAAIDILDRLPVPYGLIRYGVAPDHQGTKAVIRQFERLFERQGVAFFGNVSVGTDITLDDLCDLYDAVVLATGLSGDRRLGIPGEDLDGVLGSGAVTRAWNDHPDAEGRDPVFGRDVVIMGNGNVAIDLVRLLAKDGDEFDGSDLSPARTRTLCAVPTRRITVVGRSAAAQARFDPVMLRELGRLAQARIEVVGAAGEGKVIEALAAIDGHGAPDARHAITFRFGWTPVRLSGDGHVTQAQFTAADGAVLDLPCDTFLTAIGFEAAATGLPPMASTEDGFVAPGLYATGWFRRGPRGTIPENRADAQLVAARIAADFPGPGGRPGRAALAARLPEAVDHAGWLRIDAAERNRCPPDRCRQKIASRSQMLTIARTKGDAT